MSALAQTLRAFALPGRPERLDRHSSRATRELCALYAPLTVRATFTDQQLFVDLHDAAGRWADTALLPYPVTPAALGAWIREALAGWDTRRAALLAEMSGEPAPTPEDIPTLTRALEHDLDQLDRHGPEAPGLLTRIESRRATLERAGLPRPEQPG